MAMSLLACWEAHQRSNTNHYQSQNRRLSTRTRRSGSREKYIHSLPLKISSDLDDVETNMFYVSTHVPYFQGASAYSGKIHIYDGDARVEVSCSLA
jgi:hypothetical protein